MGAVVDGTVEMEPTSVRAAAGTETDDSRGEHTGRRGIGRLPEWWTQEQEAKLAQATVIEVPMRWGPGMPAPTEEELEAERCTYMGPADRRCGRRAVEGGMCRIHRRWEQWTEWGWPMVCPEDRESVGEALRQTLSYLMAGHITERQALAVVAICRAILRTA